MSSVTWIPLESNPDVMNQWSTAVGVDTSQACFQDVFGLDEELLAMVPRPVYALILCFPVTEKYEEHRRLESQHAVKDPPKDVIYIKQTIGNACGTMGLLHAIGNSDVRIKDGGSLKELLDECVGKSPSERASLLVNSTSLATAHSEASQQGQTRPPDPTQRVDLHFVAFVERDGKLWELDGRKEGPLVHTELAEGGKIKRVSEDGGWDMLKSAAEVVKKNFVGLAEGSLNFNLIALAAPNDF